MVALAQMLGGYSSSPRPTVDNARVATTRGNRPRQRQPLFWIALALAAAIVGAGYEALAALAGDGSFDLDQAARNALISMVPPAVVSWGYRGSDD
jgi:hypothetical protein